MTEPVGWRTPGATGDRSRAGHADGTGEAGRTGPSGDPAHGRLSGGTGGIGGTHEAGAVGDPADPRPVTFDALYARERPSIVRLAYLLVRSSPVAEELAQEAFVRLYERFDAVENPPGFLRTVVVRLSLRWLDRHAMEQQRLAVVGARLPHVEEPALDETWEALGRLRPERRAVLVLRFYEDLPYQDVAALLRCSAGTVRSRTHRALADLRKEMER